MAEIEQTTQQDFMPAKKPSIWQRLKFMSPKKKVLFWGAIIVGVVAVGLIIYFALAEDNETKFYFTDENNQQIDNIDDIISSNGTKEIEVWIKLGRSVGEIDDYGNSVEARDFNMQITIESDSVEVISCRGNEDLSVCNPDQFNTNKINITPRAGNPLSLNPGSSHKVATIVIAVDEGEQRAFINLDFEYGSSNTVTWSDGEGGGSDQILAENLFYAHYKTLGYEGGDYIYLEPINGEIFLGDTLDVAVIIVSNSTDIIAAGTTLEYNPEFFEIEKIGSPQFPVSGNESSNNGEIVLVRGTYGDGDANNGTAYPNEEKKGLKGRATLATLRIRGIEVTNGEEIKFTNTSVVIDDGQGTLTNDFRTENGSYNVVEEPPFEAELKIISGPDAYVYKDQDQYQVDIVWATNINSNGSVSSGTLGDKDGRSNIKDHSISFTLPNTALGTTHNYTVISTAGSKRVEASGSFTVQELTTSLEIRNLSVQPSYTSAVISWNTVGGSTRGLSDTQVSCSGPGNPSALPVNTTPTLTHLVKVTGLQASTLDSPKTYTCTATSNARDGDGNLVYENGQLVTVSKDTESFTTKIGQSPDANVILKVEPDRECDKWLYCRSAVQVVNSKNESESLCFDVGACDELGEDGSCILPLDIQGLAEQNYTDPEAIQNLSGLAKVGFTWSDGSQVAGYYHYADMQPEGLDVNIPNGDFELGEVWPWEADKVDNAAIRVMPDPEDGTNKVLKITPIIQSPGVLQWSNAWAPIGQIYGQAYNYAISLGIKAGISGRETKDVAIQLKVGRTYNTVAIIPVTGYWQTVVLTTQSLVSGQGYLNIGLRYTGSGDAAFSKEIYIDNVSMKSVLPVASDINQQRICRLYPSSTAPACDYTDLSGKQYRGWQGFCVEEDPKYSSFDPAQQMCLNWWPVDILPGETDIFGTDQQAGYAGRQPLYYCLEAAGSYPYYDHIVQNYYSKDDVEATDEKDVYVGNLEVYRDEILQIKINDVRIDDDSDEGWDDCGLANDYSGINPSVPVDGGKGAKGTIIFNDKNKEHWEDSLSGTSKTCDNGSTSFNKYAYLRCAQQGGENDCNIVTANLVFDTTDRLTNIKIKFDDGSPDKGKYEFSSVTITFKGPRCNVLAQVVTPGGENTAWSTRVKNGGWTQENNLSYEYSQDYAPYGAAVVPAPVSDPSLWEDPLYVMPADSSMGLQKPYQARAGSPYGADIKRICSFYTSQECETDNDCAVNDCVLKAGQQRCRLTDYLCQDDTDCDLNINKCIAERDVGVAQCIAGSADNLGKQCNSNTDCGYSLEGEGYGLCMGINLTENQKLNVSGGWQAGQENLKKLFTKSYQVWHWSEDGYVSVQGTTDTRLDSGEKFGWDITINPGMDRYKPGVSNIKIGDKEGSVIIQGLKSIVLKFNATVDENHLPMTAYRVDWGDGSAISQVSNLKIYPRTNPDKPHVLFHTYECEGISSQYWSSIEEACIYKPKIQVQDNWGWCNNGIDGDKCPSDINSWTEFGGEIIVK